MRHIPASFLIVGLALSTATIAATSATYFAVNSPNDSRNSTNDDREQTASANAKPPAEVKLCVGIDDHVLRVPPGFAGECPEGQRAFELSGDDEQLCEMCDPFDDEASSRKSDDEAVNALERRVRALENTSYFEVVSQKDEHTIFSIRPGGARFFNAAGTGVAAVATGDAGAFFTGRSAVAPAEASIGVSGNNGGVALFGNGLRTELGIRQGPYALRFPSANGLIAGLGQSRAGSGAVIIGGLTGVTEASITVTDGRAVVSFSKDGGPGGAAVAEATIGGGLLDLATARGDSAVKMGHNGHRYGIVMAGPVRGIPYVPRTGIPGSYFVGCASGAKPACIPEVAGQ